MIDIFNIQEYKGFGLIVTQDFMGNSSNFIVVKRLPNRKLQEITTFSLDNYYIQNDSYFVIKRFHEEVDKFLKNQISAEDFK